LNSCLILIVSNDFLHYRAVWVRMFSNIYIYASQTLILSFLSNTGKAPYSSVLTHGFVLDEKGLKMSKSVGNVVDPRSVIEGGKNQKASYINVLYKNSGTISNPIISLYQNCIVLRKHLHMELMSCGFGFLV